MDVISAIMLIMTAIVLEQVLVEFARSWHMLSSDWEKVKETAHIDNLFEIDDDQG